MGMDKFEIARTLDEISRYLELSESNRFKALAFERAARALRAQDRDAGELIASGALIETPGIGKATSAVIEELAREGRSRYLDELRAKFPPGIFELLRVPNLGLAKMRVRLAGIDEIEDAEVTGSVRRRLEVVRNINLAVATRKPDVVIAALLKLVENAEQAGDDVVKGLINGEMEVFFHLSAPADFGA